MEELKLLSLFSGIGSFEKALTNLGVGYDVVGFSEIDKWVIQSYCAIHGIDENLNYGDINKVNERELPYADLVTFGFPCGDVSLSGRGAGIKKGTNSGLLFEAERVIKHIKPKYAIAENVRNLTSKRYEKDFKALLDRLDDYGYNSYWEVLNSEDFGVPQNRQRVFIVSVRKDIDDGGFKFPVGSGNNSKLEDILLDDVAEKYYVDKETISVFSDVDGVVSTTDENGQPRIAVREATVKGYDVAAVGDSINVSFANSKTRRGRVGKSVAGTLEVQWNQVVLEPDSRIRKLSPLESWRLMGFYDKDYWTARRRLEKVFYHGRDRTDTQMYKQCGNAIVVDVLEEIFRKLLFP